MITREKLLVLMSQDISDALNTPDNELTRHAAITIMRTVFIHVVIPLLDSVEQSDRPVYRQMLINKVRDIIAEDDPPETPREERMKGMKVLDDL